MKLTPMSASSLQFWFENSIKRRGCTIELIVFSVNIVMKSKKKMTKYRKMSDGAKEENYLAAYATIDLRNNKIR